MNKPMIRFDGYDEDWEKVRLGEVAKLKNGYSFKSSEYVDDGDYNIVTISNVQGDQYIDSSDMNKISTLPDNINGHQILKIGDILLSMTGNVGRVSQVDMENTLLNQRVGLLEIDKESNVDRQFIFRLINDSKFENRMVALGQGAAQLNIGKSDIEGYTIYKPSLKEQEQIGNFFKTLDDLISAEEEQLQNYEQYKSAMLQNMFPKKGKSFPDLRFSGFDEDWEEKKLGDVLNKGDKERVAEPNDHNRLTVHLNGNGLSEYIPERELSDTRPFYKRSSGEIIIGKQNYFNGSIAIIPEKFDGYIASNAIMSFLNKSHINIKFIYTYISRNSYIKQREHLADGTGQKELSERNFLNFKVLVPCLNEQEQIGNFFKMLDDIINKKQEKIEQLKETKEAFLQKMFV